MKTYQHHPYHLDIAFAAFVMSLIFFRLLPDNNELKPANDTRMALFTCLIASLSIYMTEQYNK